MPGTARLDPLLDWAVRCRTNKFGTDRPLGGAQGAGRSNQSRGRRSRFRLSAADFPPVDSGLLNDRSTEESIERGEDQPNRCSTTAVVKLRPFRSR